MDFDERVMKLEEIWEEDGCLRIITKAEAREGGLDLLWIPMLEECFNRLNDQIKTKVILDLSQMNYIDSSALWKLVNWSETFRLKAVSFELANLNEHIRRILTLTRLMDKLKVVE